MGGRKVPTSEVMLRLAEAAGLKIANEESTAIAVERSSHTNPATDSSYDKLTVTCVPSTDARATDRTTDPSADRKKLMNETTYFIRNFPNGTSDGYREAKKEIGQWTVECETDEKNNKSLRWQNDQGIAMSAYGSTTDREMITEFWYEVPIPELMLQMAEDAAKEITDKDHTAISVVRAKHTGVVAKSTNPDKITVTCVPNTDDRASTADRKALLHDVTAFLGTFPEGLSEGYRQTSKEDWTETYEPNDESSKRLRGWHSDSGLFMIAWGSSTDPKHRVKTEYWYQELPADDEASEAET